MTATFDSDTPRQTRRNWRESDEPWPIWAAILVFLNILVISAKVWGLAGLVAVMVPAALGMVILLLLIVKG
ncbi:MAG: hypothetical protein JJU07_03785 [Natronohydrobacter sp.]|nr:hypothetical protein [Natronohydrobacter sp.]